ncbi:hypothetical protein [Deinococcus planocerae]|uniref:hypothetical protein n=1 Tax=Deinococcus planocerae TaxID=1737569 RepID=UPI0011AF3B44|nr:hypothetical protein [Deinococcus planocerae]
MVNPAVWALVAAGKVHLAELLCSAVMTNRVEYIDAEGRVEGFTVTLRESPTIGEFLTLCGVRRSDWWIDVVPRPGRDGVTDDLVLAPTMTLVLRSRHGEGKSAADLP